MPNRVGSVGGILLALVAMELVVRQVYHVPVAFEPGFGTIIRPGATVRWRREGRGESHWTRLGIRGREAPDLSKSSVLVLGNSFTEALQVDDDEVFTAIVERRLRRDGIEATVLNAGHSGASAADYAANAPRDESVFHPRWTVIQLSPHDLAEWAWNPQRSHFAYDGDGRLVARARPVPARGRLRAVLSPLVNHVMLLVYGHYRLEEFKEAAAAQPPLFRAAETESVTPMPTAPAPPTAYPVEGEMDLLAASHGGRVTFLFIPNLDLRSPHTMTPAEARFDAHCRQASLSCVSLRPGYAELVRRGVSPFGFENSPFNQGHLNQDGHRLAAEALSAELERLASRGLF
jgi:lysophospholipase L1-like esterase